MALTKSDKMDQAGVRTAADIEQKYNFGKSFAKAMGLAEDARTVADEAKEAAQAASDIDHEKIFNLLTNNGEVQCIREVDGQIYINASYIKSGILSTDLLNLTELFANNINMSGTFTHTVDAFLQPGEPEMEALHQAFQTNETIPYTPLWDFNSDGVVNGIDVLICRKAIMGYEEEKKILSDWAKKNNLEKPVTMTINLKNPERAITFSGVNAWGRQVEECFGVNTNSEMHRAYYPNVVHSNGAWIGEELGLARKVGLVTITDRHLNYWHGFYGFVHGISYVLKEISSSGLTVTANIWGSIFVDNGTEESTFNYYNMTQGIL